MTFADFVVFLTNTVTTLSTMQDLVRYEAGKLSDGLALKIPFLVHHSIECLLQKGTA
jgi:hypothetical protein